MPIADKSIPLCFEWVEPTRIDQIKFYSYFKNYGDG